MYVQNLPHAHASVVVGLFVLDHFLVSLSFMACPIWGWALLDGGLCFFPRPTLLPVTISYHITLSFLLRSLFYFNLAGPF